MDDTLSTVEKRLLATYLVCGDITEEELVRWSRINNTYAEKSVNSMKNRDLIFTDGAVITW